jgi:site-specific recombinase
MKLQTRFLLAILGVFLLLAAVVAGVSINWINTNSIKEAQQRVDSVKTLLETNEPDSLLAEVKKILGPVAAARG